jgi:hypothetical protein
MAGTHKTSGSSRKTYRGKHRFEHWARDNQVYFITARCHAGFPCFASEDAKQVFWERFTHYTLKHGFTPFVTSLVSNHYHTLGYLRLGNGLAPMMQGIHGSTAKLVNRLTQRRVPFWHENKTQTYFDGCIRDEKQCRLAFRYVCLQSERHGLADRWPAYPHTRIGVAVDRAVRRAHRLGAFLVGVPYKRYGGSPGA